jgi:hypothetical protein
MFSECPLATFPSQIEQQQQKISAGINILNHFILYHLISSRSNTKEL